jgi:hypothetical protein
MDELDALRAELNEVKTAGQKESKSASIRAARVIARSDGRMTAVDGTKGGGSGKPRRLPSWWLPHRLARGRFCGMIRPVIGFPGMGPRS